VADTKALVKNAADPEQVKQAKLTEKLKAEQWAADVAAVMATMQGRRFVWSILAETHQFESIFRTSSEIYYLSGQQDVGKWLTKQVARLCPKEYLTMQQEAARIEANRVEPESTKEDL
jgi:xanthine dehydrogenase iron-sulfur cluster and FAD-binding subunit A